MFFKRTRSQFTMTCGRTDAGLVSSHLDKNNCATTSFERKMISSALCVIVKLHHWNGNDQIYGSFFFWAGGGGVLFCLQNNISDLRLIHTECGSESEIFFDVCCLLFDLFCLFSNPFSLSLGLNRPIQIWTFITLRQKRDFTCILGK